MNDRIERCKICQEPTEKAGRSEDSLYVETHSGYEIGPLCEICYGACEGYYVDKIDCLEGLLESIRSVLESRPQNCLGNNDDGKEQWSLRDDWLAWCLALASQSPWHEPDAIEHHA